MSVQDEAAWRKSAPTAPVSIGGGGAKGGGGIGNEDEWGEDIDGDDGDGVGDSAEGEEKVESREHKLQGKKQKWLTKKAAVEHSADIQSKAMWRQRQDRKRRQKHEAKEKRKNDHAIARQRQREARKKRGQQGVAPWIGWRVRLVSLHPTYPLAALVEATEKPARLKTEKHAGKKKKRQHGEGGGKVGDAEREAAGVHHYYREVALCFLGEDASSSAGGGGDAAGGAAGGGKAAGGGTGDGAGKDNAHSSPTASPVQSNADAQRETPRNGLVGDHLRLRVASADVQVVALEFTIDGRLLLVSTTDGYFMVVDFMLRRVLLTIRTCLFASDMLPCVGDDNGPGDETGDEQLLRFNLALGSFSRCSRHAIGVVKEEQEAMGASGTEHGATRSVRGGRLVFWDLEGASVAARFRGVQKLSIRPDVLPLPTAAAAGREVVGSIDGPVESVCWAPCGTMVVAGTNKGTLLLWRGKLLRPTAPVAVVEDEDHRRMLARVAVKEGAEEGAGKEMKNGRLEIEGEEEEEEGEEEEEEEEMQHRLHSTSISNSRGIRTCLHLYPRLLQDRGPRHCTYMWRGRLLR
jgi:hypothetical protein